MKPEKIQKTARLAGVLYFSIIITSIIFLAVGSGRLMVEGDMVQSIDNIARNPTLFRIHMVYEILMYTGVIFLSVALYQLVKKVNRTAGLSAMLFRFGEAIMGFLTVACSMLILFLVQQDNAPGSNTVMISMLFEMKDALMQLLMIFIGVGSILFFALFYLNQYIPRWLSVFGIAAFSLVVAETIVLTATDMESLVFPGVTAVCFEIIVGLYLMIKGVRIQTLT